MTGSAAETARLGLVLVAIAALVTTGCGSERANTGASDPPDPTTTIPSPTPRTDEPDFVGTIAAVAPSPTDNPDIVGTLRVTSSRSEPVGILGDEAVIKIASGTPIWRCDAVSNLELGSFADLAATGYVSVWIDGPVAESYPVQASASAVKALIGGCD